MIAQSSPGAVVVASHGRALRDRLISEGHQVEGLDLPPIGVDHRALANIASYRLLGASSADVLICLDAVASVIPHPRKLLWLLDDTYLDPDLVPMECSLRCNLTFLANALGSAIGEAEAIFSPSSFGIERLRHLGLGSATLFAPPIGSAPVRYARNVGPELLVLAPLADRQRPELLFATIALLPEPFRVRWVAPTAQPRWPTRAQCLAAEHKLDFRMAFDVRTINDGERSYLLSQAAALIDLAPAALALADSVQSAIAHTTPVIACSDGGATCDAASHRAEPVAEDLARVILGACTSPAAPAPHPMAEQATPDHWSRFLEVLAR